MKKERETEQNNQKTNT